MSQLLEKSGVARQIEGNIELVELTFYPSTKRRGDLDNKAASILDLLVDCKIITDDSWFIVPKLVLKFGGIDRLNPRAEIYVETRKI